MCFSAEASFASAGLLLGLGGYCVRAAARKVPSYWAFAAIPVGFGLQQAAEGFVWIGLDEQNTELIRHASAVYLFFALAVWPVWFPFAAALAEPNPTRSRLLRGWALLGGGWFFLAYIPAIDSLTATAAVVVGHSIQYPRADLVVFHDTWRWPVTAAYLLWTGGPLMAMSKWREMLLPVLVGVVGIVIAAWFYRYAYISVWCFYAALLSSYCVYYFATVGEPR